MSDLADILTRVANAVERIDQKLDAAAIPVELVDADGLARMLGVSRSFVHSLDNRGLIPASVTVGDGRATRWLVREIRAWTAASCPSRPRWASIRDQILRRAG
jgi:predicted DNA-binding transcriptional regulator AlpA